MSVKPKDDKPSTSSASPIVGCCQSSNTTPENSIADYCIEEDVEAPNNNTLFHVTGDDGNAIEITHDASATVDAIARRRSSVDFKFPKRPKIDIEFQNIKYTVKQFSFKHRQFGMYILNLLYFCVCACAWNLNDAKRNTTNCFSLSFN